MKRTALLFFMLFTLFALSACMREYATCSATVVSFVFQKDETVGYAPTGAKLITESGDEVVVRFEDFRPQKIEIEGSLKIVAGADGVSISPSENYRLTFSMQDDAQLVLQAGSTIRIIEKKENLWVPIP